MKELLDGSGVEIPERGTGNRVQFCLQEGKLYRRNYEPPHKSWGDWVECSLSELVEEVIENYQ